MGTAITVLCEAHHDFNGAAAQQEGRGNTIGALLGATFITDASAVTASGQFVSAFTAVPIPSAS